MPADAYIYIVVTESRLEISVTFHLVVAMVVTVPDMVQVNCDSHASDSLTNESTKIYSIHGLLIKLLTVNNNNIYMSQTLQYIY